MRDPRLTQRDFMEEKIELCRNAGLPEPSFEMRQGSFVLTLWREWLTDDVLAGLRLNERQRQAVRLVRTTGKVLNSEYQKAFTVSKPTASRDLEELVALGLLTRVGTTGRGTHYILNRQGLRKGSKGSSSGDDAKGS